MGGRCVAGITRSGDWVRPVSPDTDGILYPRHYFLGDGSATAVLDIIRLEVAAARPEPHQPENWEVTAAQWQRLGHLQPTEARDFLRAHAITGPDLLGNRADRVPHQYLTEHPGAASLCVIQPAGLQWRVTSSRNGRRQTRASFVFAGTPYDLSVTDQIWEGRLRDLPCGGPKQAAASTASREETFLTISLSEPFNDSCFKLVAAVIEL